MSNTILINKKSPVTKDSKGTVSGFPDVCITPTPAGPTPLPYPNVAKSSDLKNGSVNVKIDGASVCLKGSSFSTSTGDEPGKAGGGVASGTTKGAATPLNFSFNVKIEGKNVVRNMDTFSLNNHNAPPFPVLQDQLMPSPPITLPEDQAPEKCPYCDEDEHTFNTAARGDHVGKSSTLSRNIFKALDKKKTEHPWYDKGWSLAAHHLICGEGMDNDDWKVLCRDFGYNINRRENGVMLPTRMELACQIGVALHRGNHSNTITDEQDSNGLYLPYPDAVKKKLDGIKDFIIAEELCTDPQKVTERLDKLSNKILSKVNDFKWTLTKDGKDYDHRFSKIGCGNVTSLENKPSSHACASNHDHQFKQKNTKKTIAAKSESLKIGA
jgi:hypothetical protein